MPRSRDNNFVLRLFTLATWLTAVVRSVNAAVPLSQGGMRRDAGIPKASMSAADCSMVVYGDSTADDGCSSDGVAMSCKLHGNNDWVPVSGLNHSGAPISNGLQKFASVAAELLGCAFRNYAFASATTGNAKQLFINDMHPEVSVYTPDCDQPGYINKTFACVPTVYQQIKDNPPPRNTTVLVNAGGNDFFNDILSILKPFLNNLQSKLESQFRQRLASSHAKLSSDEAFELFSGVLDTLGLGHKLSSFSWPIENLRKISHLLQDQHGVRKDKLFFMNLPDMSQVPATLELTKNSLALKLISLTSRVYNDRLQHQLTDWPLSKFNLPSDHLYRVDSLLANVTQDPQSYGFSPEMNETCIGEKAFPNCKDSKNLPFFWDNPKHLDKTADRFLGANVASRIAANP